MMNLRKWLWVSVAGMLVAGTALADPMRTVFTKENKFPGALKPELSLAAGGVSYDEQELGEDADSYSVAPGVRFGLTDRLALRAEVPYVGYSIGEEDESGLGDVEAGLDFLFFEDIFEYAWIIPHATGIFPTGDEDKNLGTGETQGRFGISVGTTVNDVVHFAVDVSHTVNGTEGEGDDERDDLTTGALSIMWDLDERASILGEVQLRDDPVDEQDDYALRGHGGLAYRINKRFSLMGYVGSSSGMYEDYYGMGRLVCQF